MASSVRLVAAVLLCAALAQSMQPDSMEEAQDLGDGQGAYGALGESLMKPKAAKAAKSGRRTIVMTHEDAMGMKVIDDYAHTNKKLQRTEVKLRKKLASPPEAMKGMSYNAIPGFVYKFQGRTMKGKSRSACELVCNTYSACKSYSYSPKKRTCIWSMSHVKYNPSYSLFAKKTHPEGKPDQLYSRLPGMIVQDMIKKSVKGISFEECRYDCTKDTSCKTFSYSKEKGSCVKTGVPLHYSDGYTYYEKNEPIGIPAWKKENIKENKRKKKLKMDWLKSSTKISRAKLEKQTKATKKLAKARKKAVMAERVEKGARKAANKDGVKCKLAEGLAATAVKQNMAMVGGVAKRSRAMIRLKAASEKARKTMSTKTHYEARAKAKLHYKLASTKAREAKTKHVAYVKLERKSKSKKKLASERSKKACALRDGAKGFFKTKEVKMKKREAVAKKAAKQKQEASAVTTYKKARAHDKSVSAKERKAKTTVALLKAKHEKAIKKEATATTERERKAYITGKMKAKEKVKKASARGEKDMKVTMKAKENTSKAKEVVSKKSEKEKKARLLLHARINEAKAKNKRVELKKKAIAKKEKDGKAEKVSKRRKKTEILQKKMVEQKNKGQAKLKKVKADELARKRALTKKELGYKKVKNSNERGRKSRAKRARMLKHLRVRELDAKGAARKDRLKKNNLKEHQVKANEKSRKAGASKKKRARQAAAAKKKSEVVGKRYKNASSEKTQKALRGKERNAKAKSRAANEKRTKGGQRAKRAGASANRALSRKGRYRCIRTCHQGRRVMSWRRQRTLSKELKAKALKKAAKKGKHESMLGEGVSRMTPAQRKLAAKQRAALKARKKAAKRRKAVPVTVKFNKRGKPFSYKGCKCH